VLIVEQKVRKVIKISNKVYGIKLGKVVFSDQPGKLMKHDELRKVFF